MGKTKFLTLLFRKKTGLVCAITLFVLSLLAYFFLVSSKILIGIAIVMGFIVLIYFVVKTITSDIEEENNRLKTENIELRNRHIDITQIKDVLKVALTEVESVDVRTYDRMISERIRFLGALRIKIKAQYGIDVEELRIKYDGGTLQFANVNPKYLAFSERTLSWDFRITLKYAPVLKFWRTKDSNDKYTIEQSELIRKDVEKQLNEKGLDSLEWLTDSIQYKVLTCLQVLFRTSNIQILDSYDDSFLPLQDFMNEQQKSIKALHE